MMGNESAAYLPLVSDQRSFQDNVGPEIRRTSYITLTLRETLLSIIILLQAVALFASALRGTCDPGVVCQPQYSDRPLLYCLCPLNVRD